MKRLIRELLLYGVIGCSSTALDFVLYWFLSEVAGLHYQVANCISVATSLTNGFLWNYFCNFKVKGHFGQRLVGFYGVGMFGWMIGAVQLWLFVEVLCLGSVAAKVLAICMCTVVQFLLNKFITFRAIGENEMPRVEHLEWDSSFFGFKVGRISIGKSCDTKKVRELLAVLPNRLTYIMADWPVKEELRKELQSVYAIYVEDKVVYRKQIAVGRPLAKDASLSIAGEITAAIEELGYESGWLSRFNKDVRLRPRFKELYLKWLEKDLRNGRIVVFPSCEAAEGMATVTHDGKVGHVGLISVSKAARKKGIGTRLMRGVEEYLYSNGVKECEVVTQGENQEAQRLYKGCGYVEVSRVEVWHLWKEN